MPVLDELRQTQREDDLPSIAFPIPFLLAMGKAETVDELLDTIAVWVARIIPSARCSIALLDQDGAFMPEECVRIFALMGNAAVPVGHPLPLSGSNPGRAILARSPVVIADTAQNDTVEAPMLVQGGLRSCVCCPLISGTRCFGTINVAHGEPDHYKAADIEVLRGIASWVATHLRMAKLVDELSARARTDYLTGILNRQAFSELSGTLFRQWQRRHTHFALAVMDIDHFKSVNDTFGHQAGDKVLIGFCDRIKHRLRSSDVFARLGGEEFALLLSGDNQEGAHLCAERYRELIAGEPFSIGGKPKTITVSIGLTVPSEADHDFDQLLRRADRFLYRAKKQGRNRVVGDGMN